MKSDKSYFERAAAALKDDPTGHTAAIEITKWCAHSKNAVRDPRYYAVAREVAKRQNRHELVEFNTNRLVETTLALRN